MPADSFSKPPLRLAVLISGGGSTMVNLQEKILAGDLHAVIPLVIASRDCAGLQRAEEINVEAKNISPKSFSSTQEFSNAVFSEIRDADADLVLLAGYLSKIIVPDDFANRVMNIHPSLIPAFCGKGMYGHHVHDAVISRGCKVSGCTVHFCDNEYDHGPIILQQTVSVDSNDDANTLAARVQAAECEAYPKAVRLFGVGRLNVKHGRVRISD